MRRKIGPMTPAERRAAPPLAFVTPWYGPDIPGGAEALGRDIDHGLQRMNELLS